MKRVHYMLDAKWASDPLLSLPEKELVAVPGDGLYKVTKEVACVMQRVQQESECSIYSYAQTFPRLLRFVDTEGRDLVLAFEVVDDMGVVWVVDHVLNAFSDKELDPFYVVAETPPDTRNYRRMTLRRGN